MKAIPGGGETALNSSMYKYKFGGNEFQDELGLNVYDYDQRIYDQATGRFWQMDPLAEQGRRWSPYNYCFDNPIYFQDPDGMWPSPGWLKSYAKAAWKATANLVVGAATSSYTTARNGVNATKQVVKAYNQGGVKAAAKEYVNQVYETSGAKSAVETTKKAATGDPEAVATTVVNVAAVVITHKVAKGSAASTEAGEAGSASSKGSIAKSETVVTTEPSNIPSPGKGKGSVPPSERDPKRAYSASEKQEMLDNQNGACAQCGETKTVQEVDGHHIVRHADGGATSLDNGAALCKECHKEIHK